MAGSRPRCLGLGGRALARRRLRLRRQFGFGCDPSVELRPSSLQGPRLTRQSSLQLKHPLQLRLLLPSRIRLIPYFKLQLQPKNQPRLYFQLRRNLKLKLKLNLKQKRQAGLRMPGSAESGCIPDCSVPGRMKPSLR
jgi:hypothetical protein